MLSFAFFIVMLSVIILSVLMLSAVASFKNIYPQAYFAPPLHLT